MFRKPRRAYRVHRKDESDKESDESQSELPKHEEPVPPVASKASASKATLSFGDDLEGEFPLFLISFSQRRTHLRLSVQRIADGL